MDAWEDWIHVDPTLSQCPDDSWEQDAFVFTDSPVGVCRDPVDPDAEMKRVFDECIIARRGRPRKGKHGAAPWEFHPVQIEDKLLTAGVRLDEETMAAVVNRLCAYRGERVIGELYAIAGRDSRIKRVRMWMRRVSKRRICDRRARTTLR